MNRKSAWFLWLITCLGLLLVNPVLAQSATAVANPPADSDSAPASDPGPVAIAAGDIVDRAIATTTMLRSISTEIDGDYDIEAIRNQYSSYRSKLTTLHEETGHRLGKGGSAMMLEETKRKWLQVERHLNGWLQSLADSADEIDRQSTLIKTAKTQWELTRDGSAADLPGELMKTIRDTIDAIGKTESQLRAKRDNILTLQARVGQLKADTINILDVQKQEIAQRRQAAFSLDSPPLWKIFSQQPAKASGTQAFSKALKEHWNTLRNHAEETSPSPVNQVIMFSLLLIAVMTLRNKVKSLQDQQKSLAPELKLLNRPFAVASVIFLPFIILLYPGAPPAWSSLLGVALVAATLRLLPRLIHPSKHTWAYLFACVILLWQSLQVISVDSPGYRLVLMLLSVMGVVLCLTIVRTASRMQRKLKKRSRYVTTAGRIGAGLFIVTLVANIIGSVSIADIITDGTLFAIFAALLLFVLVLVLESLMSAGLQTKTGHRFGFVRLQADSVHKTFSHLLRFLAFSFWGYIVLSGYLLIDPAITFVTRFLEADMSIGNFSVSLADILIVSFVTWLSFKLSQFIEFVLNTDVFPHTQLPRGAPEAITSLTHYVVIVVGVLIAFSAAGFDLSRITIIIGALGVGIGFGLQNVVNNFVSGLILLFERPIKVGDVVEIDGTLGVVKNIAMRASIVRNYDGADIIVPNSDLVSTKVVNWTYKSDLRRSQVPIGVAYGTDPQQVIDLLLKVAKDNDGISTRLEPKVLFLEFGDSSLNFLLRFWTPTSTYMNVGSELRVAIAHALTEAGIEIPFPQRDLHVRSIDKGARLKEETGPEL
jgi:potassium efflux system protein